MNTSTYETHTKNWGGGAGFALLLLLFTASDASAQATTRYIDPESGSGTTCTRSAPCQLVEAYKLTNADDTNFLILVPFTGGTVEVIPPGSANKLTEKVRFGTYVQGSDAAVEGTIRFVRPSGEESQPFLIASSGQVWLNAKASVEFGDVAVDARGLNDADDFFLHGQRRAESDHDYRYTDLAHERKQCRKNWLSRGLPGHDHSGRGQEWCLSSHCRRTDRERRGNPDPAKEKQEWKRSSA